MRRTAITLSIILLIAAVGFYVFVFASYQDNRRDASVNAQTESALIRLTVEQSLNQ